MLYLAENFWLLRMFPDLKNYFYGLQHSPESRDQDNSANYVFATLGLWNHMFSMNLFIYVCFCFCLFVFF